SAESSLHFCRVRFHAHAQYVPRLQQRNKHAHSFPTRRSSDLSMQISISSLQTHNVNRCGRSRHLARKLSLRRKRSRAFSPNDDRSEERFSRNAETDLVCRLLLEKKKK